MICSFKAQSKGYPAVSISLYVCRLNSYLQESMCKNTVSKKGGVDLKFLFVLERGHSISKTVFLNYTERMTKSH